MAIDLPPSEVILNALFIGVVYNSCVKGGDLFKLDLKVVAPVEDVGRGEGWNYAAQDLVGAAGE
jgi:hypothetical protein